MSSTRDTYAWADQAACQGEDLNLFYPEETGAKAQSKIDQALAVCARCDVRDACRDAAFERRDVYGIQGGTTGPQRDAILNPKVPAQRTPSEAKTPVPAAERKRAYRERNRDRINAGKREAYGKKRAAEAARAKKNERTARYRAINRDEINAGKREARAARTPERAAAERAVETERKRIAYANLSDDARERRREKNREWMAKRRDQERAEREALELLELEDDGVTEPVANEEDGLSVA